MHPDFHQFMNQATRLTQAGDLTAATAAIQTALRGVSPVTSATPTTTSWQEDPNVIDVEARVVPETSNRNQTVDERPEEAATSARTARDHNERFIEGTFRNAAGRRNYKLYVPPGADAVPLPLVVMLHGCTQNAEDFAAGTEMNRAGQEHGFYVLYPEQSPKANPQKCWNWFKHNHQQKGRGETSILADMTREVMKSHSIDPRRVYVAGLSAGGAMAAILGQAHPELYAAVGVHSGLAPGMAKDLPSALAAMKGTGANTPVGKGSGVPVIVFHGDRDSTVNLNNAHHVVAASAGSSAHAESVRVTGPSGSRSSTQHTYRNAAGAIVAEYWQIHGGGHAWAGGSASGSYTDQTGPDATAEMLRFFLEHPHQTSGH